MERIGDGFHKVIKVVEEALKIGKVFETYRSRKIEQAKELADASRCPYKFG